MEVEVVRSRRRRKTVQASKRGDVVRISIPASMTKAEEARWVEEMVRRLDRRHRTAAGELTGRATTLARRHALRMPADVRWVDNQRARWASCTPADGTIRISSRAADFPAWVVDYLLVHELAHLDEPGHGPAFWAIVNRYPKAERARGFLIAKGLEDGS